MTTGHATPLRALFVNSGMLGHATVARLMHEAMSGQEDITAAHLDLSRELTPADRVLRRVIGVRPFASLRLPDANLDLTRWRREVNTGVHAARRIRALERKHGRFDVLHLHPQPIAYMSIRRMRRTPTIISIDATSSHTQRGAAGKLQQLSHMPGVLHDRAVFMAAAAIVATSRWAASDVALLHPDCAAKTHVLPYPVRISEFDPAWAAARARRAHVEGYRPRVLFMGGDFGGKGGDDLLAAWQRADFGTSAQLDIATARPVAAAEGLQGVRVHTNVKLYSPRWRELWQDADVFVLPTYIDVFGMVLQEAAAAGLPVITTNQNAAPEIVIGGETGFLHQPGDLAALSAALAQLLADGALRQRMGAAARARIERSAAIDAYGERLSNLIRQVAARQPA